ncbi:MAG TPA: hypothetical protein PLX23_11505, partial [Candidatus Hydrogenedens sp.]|nr:hypothetical protein [Candidatus Hydrogenedens sp.]
ERLKGSLSVILSPSEVIANGEEEGGEGEGEDGEEEEKGAKWRRVGEEVWLDSGAIEKNLPVDVYEIEFKPVYGWDVPEKTLVDLKEEIVNEVFAIYTRQQGELVVNILPEEAVKAGAMWRFTGETSYRKSGEIIKKEVEKYTIEFSDVSNWTKPDSIEVEIPPYNKLVIDVKYIPASIQEGEGVKEGINEGEGEGESEKPSICGCNDKEGVNQIKQIFSNLFVVGISLGILCMWMGVKKEDNK